MGNRRKADHGKTPAQYGTSCARDSELTALVARAAAARQGETGCAVLTAPAGYGKAPLLDALLDAPACRDMTVLRGRCGAAPDDGAYSGLRAMFAAPGTREPHRSGPGQVGDGPAALLPERGHGHPERFVLASAYPVFRRLSSHILRLTADRPVLLALGDAHRCDEHSLRWLEFLLRRASGRPLLIVLGRRSDAPAREARAWADLLAHPATSVMALAPLSTDSVGLLTEEVFGRPAHPLLARSVAEVTGGNPRTVLRLLHELRRRDAAPDEAGALRATELGAGMAAGSVRCLLGRAPVEVRAVAAAIALLGGTRHPERVAILAGVDRAQSEEAIAVLRHAGALAPDGAIVHEAVRSALLEPLDAARIADLHARAALLLSDAGRPAEEAAQHLMRMPRVREPWMTAVLRDAATSAEQRGALSDAAPYLRRVLDAEPDDAEARLRLALATAPADPRGAVPLFREALAGTSDTLARAGVAVQYAMACLSVPLPAALRGEILGALEAAKDALASDTEADTQLRDQVASVLLVIGRRRTGAAEREPRTTAAARYRLRTDPLQTEVLAALRAVLAGHSREAALEGARRSLAAPSPEQPAWLLLTAAATLGLADESEEAHTALDAVLRRADNTPDAGLGVLVGSLRSHLLHRDGAVLEAAAQAHATIATAEGEAQLVTARSVLACVLVDRGEPHRAERLLAEAGEAEPNDSAPAHLLYLHARARSYWAAGRLAQALQLLDECGWAQETAGVQNPVFAPWWVDSCQILAGLHRPADGRELAEQGAERARRWGTPRALGLAALAAGVLTPGRAGLDLLAESAHQLSRSPAATEYARAEYLLGQALLRNGDEAGARERLRKAAGIAGGCGALALAEAARRLLVSAGGRPGNAAGASTRALLTTTELTVAELAVTGASNRQIAQRLFITVRTVESHLTNVYRKLRVRRRDGLVDALRAVHSGSELLPDGRAPARTDASPAGEAHAAAINGAGGPGE